MKNLFAVTPPGLKSVASHELASLGLSVPDDYQGQPAIDPSTPVGNRAPPRGDDEAGGVPFAGGLEAIYQANLQLRTPTRILVRVGEFYAAAFSELRKKAGRLDWERYLHPGAAVAIRVTAQKSRLYHSDAVAERVLGAIGDRLGRPSTLAAYDENTETSMPQLVVVRLVRDLCTVSVDSSGPSLHRRGYRKATAKAPLRENLAAGMLLTSGWTGGAPLLDPFCGSGTIPIEAALLARDIPPGRWRRFAFMDWPGYQAERWEELLHRADQQVSTTAPTIQASDRDEGAVEMAQANAGRAGVAEWIDFSHRALSSIEPQGVGWVVTNPPYGLRVSAGKDLRNLYAQLGNVLRRSCQGWKVAILSSDDRLLDATGLRFDQKISMVNGGVSVRLALGEVK